MSERIIVTPWLDHGVQKKIKKDWIPWSSHGMTPSTFFDPRNNASRE
ncbi:PH domain-containing protein [Rickettsia tamurae]